MSWLHPVLGFLTVVLVLWMAAVGLRLRRPGPEVGRARRLHRWLAPVAGALVVVTAAAGTASVLWLRDDMDLAETTHFVVGWAAVALAALAGLTAALRRRLPVARAVHPWLGLLLALACVVLTLLGLEHLP
jgi:hypothetical protein